MSDRVGGDQWTWPKCKPRTQYCAGGFPQFSPQPTEAKFVLLKGLQEILGNMEATPP